ncbi:MAG: hypothetical protein WC549_00500 [Actinomycetota bacterium]
MLKNNNFYSLEDFVATILRTPFKREDIKAVVAAWGNSNGESKKESGTELKFGVLIELKTGHVVYVGGWNDYTGWGCQDGIEFHYLYGWELGYDNKYWIPKIKKECKKFIEIDKYDGFEEIEWEDYPSDLNKWIKGEMEVNIEYLKP